MTLKKEYTLLKRDIMIAGEDLKIPKFHKLCRERDNHQELWDLVIHWSSMSEMERHVRRLPLKKLRLLGSSLGVTGVSHYDSSSRGELEDLIVEISEYYKPEVYIKKSPIAFITLSVGGVLSLVGVFATLVYRYALKT